MKPGATIRPSAPNRSFRSRAGLIPAIRPRGDGDIGHGVERVERVDRLAARDDEVGATALDMPADCGFAFEFELR